MRDRRPASAARDRARASEERSLTSSEPRFVGSFPRADVPLDPPLPEIAGVGRSNVGKSSLLNALAGRRIARVSATPGKTRALNVYEMPLVGGAWCLARSSEDRSPGARRRQPLTTHHALYFLDLPGYGYSRASQTERAAFHRLIGHALDRARLTGVLWLLDIRREPSPEDRAMQDLLAARGARVLVAITKSDKLPRGQRLRRERELRHTLALAEDQVIATSTRTGEGIDELREVIAALVRHSVT